MNQKYSPRVSLLFVSLFFLSFFAEAQVRYGAKAGVNFSNITQVNGVSKSRVGMNAGLLALIPLDRYDIFYIQPEVFYSNEGEFLVGSDKEYKNYLNFIKVPILFKAYFSGEENEFFGEVGPYFAFKVFETIDAVDNPKGGQKFNSFDFGFSLGAGYSISRQIEIGARLSYGISDMVENDWENKSNKNSTASIGVSYILY